MKVPEYMRRNLRENVRSDVRQAKTQISLLISLISLRNLTSLAIQQNAPSEDSHQTARMRVLRIYIYIDSC